MCAHLPGVLLLIFTFLASFNFRDREKQEILTIIHYSFTFVALVVVLVIIIIATNIYLTLRMFLHGCVLPTALGDRSGVHIRLPGYRALTLEHRTLCVL